MSESPTPGLTVSEVLSNRKSFASRYSIHDARIHSRSFTPTASKEPLTEEEEEEYERRQQEESSTIKTNRVLHLSSSPEPIEQEEFSLLNNNTSIDNKNTNFIINNNNVNEEEENIVNSADKTDSETNNELVPWIWWSSRETSPSPEPQTNVYNDTYTSTRKETQNEEMKREVEQEKEETSKMENHIVDTSEVETSTSANTIDRARSMSLVERKSYLTLEHSQERNKEQEEEQEILEEQVKHDASFIIDDDDVKYFHAPEETNVVVPIQTSLNKVQEVVLQQKESLLNEEAKEEFEEEEKNKHLEQISNEQEQVDEVEYEKEMPTQAELERLSSQWVPCPLSGFPPRYRNTKGGYYCTYCTYSVCEDCYKLIPCALLYSNNLNDNSNISVHTGGSVHTDLNCSPMSLTSSLECTAISSCITTTTTREHIDNNTIKCHLCKRGNLIHEEVLLHEWSCEGPIPAIRLKRGANIVYDTNLLQRYYYIKEQREKRTTSYEPLVAHYHGMTSTFHKNNNEELQEKSFQVNETCNVHSSCYCPTNRPYCVQEGQSFIFAVDNYRLTVPCVWCAITLIPSSSSSSSLLEQQTISGIEELSQEHSLYNKNSQYHNDAIYYAYSVTPLFMWKCPPSLPSLQPKPFELSTPLGSYYKNHIHALALYELSSIYHKVSTQFVPLHFHHHQQQQSSSTENLLTPYESDNKTTASSSLANSMFSFAAGNSSKTNHMTSIPLSNLTSVKVLPSQMLRPLLVVNVLHHDDYHMAQVQRQHQMQLNQFSNERFDRKENVGEKKNKNKNTEHVKQRTKKRKREVCVQEEQEKEREEEEKHSKSKTTTAITNTNEDKADDTTTKQNNEQEKMQISPLEYNEQDKELIRETTEVTDHIKAGRHVAVFGLGSKHYFLHHVAHSASLIHYQLCVIDPVYVNNNSSSSSSISNRHSIVSSRPVNILRQIREIDDYLLKQQERKEQQQKEQSNAKVRKEQVWREKNISGMPSLSSEENFIREKYKVTHDNINQESLVNVISIDDEDENKIDEESVKENKCFSIGRSNNTKYKTPTSKMQKSKASLQTSLSQNKEQHMQKEITNRNVNVMCAECEADVHERNTGNATRNVSNVKMLNYKTYHFSELNNEILKTLHFTMSAISFANNTIKQSVFAQVQKVIDRQRNLKCVRWSTLPSFLCNESEKQTPVKETETQSSKSKKENELEHFTNSPQQLPPHASSSSSSSSFCKLLVVIHNIDQLAESAIRYLAQLCTKWMHSPFAFQIICSFDDVHWLNISSFSPSSSLSQLINTLTTSLIVHNLHSLIVPRVHEHQHIHPMHLLTEYEGITGNSVHNSNNNKKMMMSSFSAINNSSSSLGRRAQELHSSFRNTYKMNGKRVKFVNNRNSSTGASAPLHDTMRRILFSLPDTFTELLRIMLVTQEDAGDGVYLSLFHHVEQFENNGLMVSQGRLKALQRELISNRLASYNSAEHSIVIHQHRRLQRVLDEVTALRKNGSNDNNNKNVRNGVNSAAIHVENGLADVTNEESYYLSYKEETHQF